MYKEEEEEEKEKNQKNSSLRKCRNIQCNSHGQSSFLSRTQLSTVKYLKVLSSAKMLGFEPP